jgi:hypothetical protein
MNSKSKAEIKQILFILSTIPVETRTVWKDGIDIDVPDHNGEAIISARAKLRALLDTPDPKIVAYGNFQDDGTLVGLSEHVEDYQNWAGRKPLTILIQDT